LVIFNCNTHIKDIGSPVMQEREARLLYESGDLETIVIQRSKNENGWTLRLKTKNGDEQMLNSKRSKSPRIFKTSDASLRCCLRIGESKATIVL